MSQSSARLKQYSIVQGLRPQGRGLLVLRNGCLHEPIITVGEYLYWRQPEVVEMLCVLPKVATIWDVRVVLDFKAWRAIMEERPKPGRGGLLPGEVKS